MSCANATLLRPTVLCPSLFEHSTTTFTYLWRIAFLSFALVLSGANIAYSQVNIFAAPNPIIISPSATYGQTTIYASGPCCDMLGVHVGSPTGPLFTEGQGSLASTTGNWVSNPTTFYLMDENTGAQLAQLTVNVLTGPNPTDTSGCLGGPATYCTDPVPATFLSGSWLDTNFTSEWTMTSNGASIGGTNSSSGYVYVFNPNDNCPVVTYQLDPGSYYQPGSSSLGTEGRTYYYWAVSNPNPSYTCGGYTPVDEADIYGYVANKGNDTSTGNYDDSIGQHFSFDLLTNLILTPSGDTVNFTSFGSGPSTTMGLFYDSLASSGYGYPSDPYSDMFRGRQVYETNDSSQPTDSCFDSLTSTGGNPPFGSRWSVRGSVWNVGGNTSYQANSYGSDAIGPTTGLVDFYRNYTSASVVPCGASLTQDMYIVNNIPGYSDNLFATHTLGWSIYSTYVTVYKDASSQTVSY